MQVLLPVYICIFGIVTNHQATYFKRGTYEKVCLKKLVTTFLFISLVVIHPCDISAKESASDDFESTFELSQSRDFADDIQIITASDEKPTIKTDVEKKASIKDNIIQDGTDKVGEPITKSNDRNDPVIYYGSYTGYLTGTNDYLLYPASLSAGQYIQVKLTLPDDSSIDYDLWLLDSSFSTIKTSDYYTVTTSTMTSTLPESLGYIVSSAETVYVCVYSVGGGSTTDAYTLDYVIGEDNYDSFEPNENAKEAVGLLTDMLERLTYGEDEEKRSILKQIDKSVSEMKDIEKAYSGNKEFLRFGVKFDDDGNVSYHANYKDCANSYGIQANSADELLEKLMSD